MTTAGFPHSDICGSRLVCSSPQHFAAYHVLHRLLVPRHSPYALISLIYSDSPYIIVFLNTLHESRHFEIAVEFSCCITASLFSTFLNVFFSAIYFLYAVFKVHFAKAFTPAFHYFLRKKSNSWAQVDLEPLACSEYPLFTLLVTSLSESNWWAQVDSNHRPHAYQACALTS